MSHASVLEFATRGSRVAGSKSYVIQAECNCGGAHILDSQGIHLQVAFRFRLQEDQRLPDWIMQVL